MDIDSFMVVTGPKYDVWLVKTVSALLVAIAVSLLSFLAVRTHPLPAILLGGLTALGLATIDLYYTALGHIRWVYLLDAAPELLFVVAWLYLLVKKETLVKTMAEQPSGGVPDKAFKNPWQS